MITLYSFGPAFGLIDPSPFVIKAHFLLKLSGLSYKTVSGVKGLSTSPKGKLPYIDDDGELIADSHFIHLHLQQKYNFMLDEHLTDEQSAQSCLMCSAVEEKLYWYAVYFRWFDDNNWPVIKKTFFSVLPFPLSYIVPKVARKSTIKALHAQGTARHTPEEIIKCASQLFSALSTILNGQDYFYNNKISTLDIVVYSLLIQILVSEIDSPLKQALLTHEGLVQFCERIKTQYFESS